MLRQLGEQESGADAQARETDRLAYLARWPLMVTTPFVEIPGLRVVQTLPMIGATHVEGMHLFKDLASGFRDVFGGRSGAIESSYQGLYASVLKELQAQAIEQRAHAVVCVALDFGEMPGKMLYIAAHGTPVIMARGSP